MGLEPVPFKEVPSGCLLRHRFGGSSVALFRPKLLASWLNIVTILVFGARFGGSVGGWHIHSRDSCQTRLQFDSLQDTLNIASEAGVSARRYVGKHCGIQGVLSRMGRSADRIPSGYSRANSERKLSGGLRNEIADFALRSTFPMSMNCRPSLRY
jgi:hypothetical protein